MTDVSLFRSNAAECAKLGAVIEGASRVAVIGIGNFYRSDDAAGIVAVRLLMAEKGYAGGETPLCEYSDRGRSFLIIDAGVTPENYIDEVLRFAPDAIVIIDCADFAGHGVPSGGIKIFDESFIAAKTTLSTHSIPLGILLSIFKKMLSGFVLKIVGIQAETVETTDTDVELSPPVRSACGIILKSFI